MVPTLWARTYGGIGWGCDVLLEKLPEVEGRPTTRRIGGAWTGRLPAFMGLDPLKEEEGHLH